MLSLGNYTKNFFEISYLVSGRMFLNLSGNGEHLTCPFNSREPILEITWNRRSGIQIETMFKITKKDLLQFQTLLISILKNCDFPSSDDNKIPPWRYTTHSGRVFYSPLSGFSLLAYEVTWSHTATRHSR
jgi:hypothetical protein